MKKNIAIILSLAIAITAVFAACANNGGKEGTGDSSTAPTTTKNSITNADTEIGFEEIEVTDEKGNTVTEKGGTPVTTEVAVIYTRNESGQVIGKILDENGEIVTRDNGEEATIIVNPETTTAGTNPTTNKNDKETSGKQDNPSDDSTTGGDKPSDGSSTTGGDKPSDGSSTTGGDKPSDGNSTTGGDKPSDGNSTTGGDKPSDGSSTTGGDNPSGEDNTDDISIVTETTTTTTTRTTTETTTNTTKKGDDTTATTDPVETTTKQIVGVPTTDDKGKGCEFSAEDQQIVKHMLEVPYLYNASYEHADGVPIKIASHAALWMLQKDGLPVNSYASGTVVIDLFKYFGRTVVGFKAKCNDEGDCANIRYNEESDSFTVSSFESDAYDISSTHTVSKLRFEDLGNNYFKVTADVDGVKGVKKVIAILEKNRLDNSLGFSIKALKWK